MQLTSGFMQLAAAGRISTEALEGHFYLLLITYYLLLITYHIIYNPNNGGKLHCTFPVKVVVVVVVVVEAVVVVVYV